MPRAVAVQRPAVVLEGDKQHMACHCGAHILWCMSAEGRAVRLDARPLAATATVTTVKGGRIARLDDALRYSVHRCGPEVR